MAPETYRHWKKVLSPLRKDKGHSPCFTSGDLIAVSVIQRLSTDLGIRIGALAQIADNLFDLCNMTPWPTLERGKLAVDIPNAKLELRPELSESSGGGILIIIPLRSLIAQLRDQLLSAAQTTQPSLPFPLTDLSSPTHSAVVGDRS